MTRATRRTVLGGISGAVLAGPALAAGVSFTIPDGACDCHHHIYDPRFAYIPGAFLNPPPVTVADYRALQKRLYTSRNIMVQPTSYGTDNRCLLDGMAQMGPACLGVCVANSSVTDAELKSLHDARVRGLRIRLGMGDAVKLEEIAPLARRIAPLGWHMQFNMAPEQIVQMETLLLGLPVPVILDHLGHATDTVSPHYRTVRKLLDSGRGWIKLSGAYLYGAKGPPGYADTSEAARGFIAAAPERCVWGSNWPHPDASSGRIPVPDDVGLLNLLAAWVPDEKLRHRILVENPEAFYGFDPGNRPKAI